MQISDLTFVGFLSLGGIRCLSYLPQIVRIIRDDNGASAISYTTWFTWIFANLATALYAVFNLGDAYLATVSVIYAFFCTVVLLLTAFKRLLYRNRARPKAEASRGGNPILSACDAVPFNRRAPFLLDLNARRFLGQSNPLRSIEKNLFGRGLRA
jgi:PQ loop repeat